MAISARSMLCAARRYSLFYILMLGWQSLVLVLLALPWALLTRRLPLPRFLLSARGGGGGGIAAVPLSPEG